MLNDKELEAISDELAKTFKQVEKEVIEDILRRMEDLQVIPSTDYQLWRLKQIGEHKKYINKVIQKCLKLSNDELNKVYKETIKEGYVRDKMLYESVGQDFIPYEENEPLQQLIGAVRKQTEGDFKNITGTIGFVINGEGIKEDAYFKSVLNKTDIEIATGVFDYNTALKKAVNDMVNSGVRYIDYESGHRDRVDVAVRRAVMTGVNQVTAQISQSNAEKLHTDKYEVSAHSTARPSHMEWQGKVYTMQELIDICGLGEVTGLCGANCYHHYDPFIEGVSVRKYTDEYLDSLKKKANEKKEYDGKKYTTYEATQEQRYLERQMRGLNEKLAYLKKYNASKDTIFATKTKYQHYLDRYKDFSQKMGLPYQTERIFINDSKKVSETPKHEVIDIQKEFAENSTPNVGTFKADKGISTNSNEYKTADLLFKSFGGNIRVNKENPKERKIKQPDITWNGKAWEEKTATSLNAIDNRIKKGITQIVDKVGGIALNIKNKDLSDAEIIERTTARMKISPLDFKTIIIRDGRIISILGKK